MSDHYVTATWPTARKEHTCHMCSRTIGKGETYRRQGYVFDGRRSHTKVCEQCAYFAEALFKSGFESEEGGWAYLPELDSGEVAYCGFSKPHDLYRHKWRRYDGHLYTVSEIKSITDPQGANRG